MNFGVAMGLPTAPLLQTVPVPPADSSVGGFAVEVSAMLAVPSSAPTPLVGPPFAAPVPTPDGSRALNPVILVPSGTAKPGEPAGQPQAPVAADPIALPGVLTAQAVALPKVMSPKPALNAPTVPALAEDPARPVAAKAVEVAPVQAEPVVGERTAGEAAAPPQHPATATTPAVASQMVPADAAAPPQRAAAATTPAIAPQAVPPEAPPARSAGVRPALPARPTAGKRGKEGTTSAGGDETVVGQTVPSQAISAQPLPEQVIPAVGGAPAVLIAAAAFEPAENNVAVPDAPQRDTKITKQGAVSAAAPSRTSSARDVAVGREPNGTQPPESVRLSTADAVATPMIEHNAKLVSGEAASADPFLAAPAASASSAPAFAQGAPAHATAAPEAKLPVVPADAQPQIAARPGQIGHEVGIEIARRLSAGGDELVVRLVPAELGRIEVRMSFDERGGLRAVIAADSPVALDMLRRDSADLSRSLSDAGVRSDGQSLRFQTDSGSGGNPNQQRSPWLDADTTLRRGAHAGLSDDSEMLPYQALRTSGRYDLLA